MNTLERSRRAVETVRRWIGTPYRHQGSVPGTGLDCLGLVRALWREVEGAEPEPIPNYPSSWARPRGGELLLGAACRWFVRTEAGTPAPADVLVFRMRARAEASHCGIATGEGTFVHAYQGNGTVETRLDAFWRRRLVHTASFPCLAHPSAKEAR